MYIKRKIEDTILRYLDKKEILAIVGPRQAGKTTVLKKIQAGLKKAIYLSFEDLAELELFVEDIKSFADKYQAYHYLFIDEFQYAKNGGRNLKYLADFHPEFKIIISGSSAIDLSVKTLKFLVGRVLIFNLYQLDFEEYLNFKAPDLARLRENFKTDLAAATISPAVNKQFLNLLADFIRFGAYPRVVLATSAEEKEVILKNIYNTYFLREVRDILGLIDDFKLAKLIKALALQIGQLVNYSELAQIADYDHLSLKKYLNFLEKTFICQSVRPFFRNKRKEIVKNPKIYFFDSGLRNYIVGNFNAPADRADKGALWENFIFSELIKTERQINFWRAKSGREVDFIYETAAGLVAIESKSSAGGGKAEAGLAEFTAEYHPAAAYLLNEKKFGRLKDSLGLPLWII